MFHIGDKKQMLILNVEADDILWDDSLNQEFVIASTPRTCRIAISGQESLGASQTVKQVDKAIFT